MKELLENLDMSVSELSYLLAVPRNTLYSWIHRKSLTPDKASPFINALEKYLEETSAEVRNQAQNHLDLITDDALEAERQQTLKTLRNELERLQLRREELLAQRAVAWRRIHLTQNLPNFLSTSLRTTEQVLSWQSIMLKTSQVQLHRASRLELMKLEYKIAGLEAELILL